MSYRKAITYFLCPLSMVVSMTGTCQTCEEVFSLKRTGFTLQVASQTTL